MQDSHAAVSLLHQEAFLDPAFHVKRKGLGGEEALRSLLLFSLSPHMCMNPVCAWLI